MAFHCFIFPLGSLFDFTLLFAKSNFTECVNSMSIVKQIKPWITSDLNNNPLQAKLGNAFLAHLMSASSNMRTYVHHQLSRPRNAHV